MLLILKANTKKNYFTLRCKMCLRLFSLFLIVGLYSCNEISVKPRSPNIILINVDDLGWRDTGVYGSSYYETPFINMLAKQGVMFKNAYAAGSNCTPSRAALITGQSMVNTGVYAVGTSNRGDKTKQKLKPIANSTFADSLVTIAEELNSSGYRTACIGKWDFHRDPISDGFDVAVAGGKLGFPKSHFSPYQFLGDNLKDGPEGENLCDRMTDEAISFIQDNSTQNFFLYLSYFSVHYPVQSKKQLKQKYISKPAGQYQNDPTYAGMIENLDLNIGKLIHNLEQRKLLDNTAIIFTSDNGGTFSNYPLRGGKGVYYEGGIKIPLIIKYKNLKSKGIISDKLVSHLDIYPTIIDLVGLKKSSKRNLEGESLLDIISVDYADTRPLFWHFPIYLGGYPKHHGSSDYFRQIPGSAVRKGEWKLFHYFENDNIELYNLKNDPGEKDNLADKHPNKTSELISILNDWRSKVSAPIPSHLPK